MTTEAAPSAVPPSALPPGLSAHALSGVFDAIGGLRNRRAIVALLGCLVAGVLLSGLLFALGSALGPLFGLLGSLVYLLAVAVGVNAAGLLQMDRARGVALRPIGEALATALLCLPKLILLGLALGAGALAVFIVLGLLFFLCKIPFLGPLLYVVVFPISVVVGGLTLTGISVCMALSLPAIWQGATLGDALTQTLAIIRGRLVETLVLLLCLGLLCFGVGLVVFSIVGAGMIPAVAMSAWALGFGGGGGLVSMLSGAGGGIAVAAFVGSSLLFAVAGALVGQVYLLGLSIVYLRVSEDLDTRGAAAAWRAGVDAVRARAGSADVATAGADSTGRPPSAPVVAAAAVAAPPVPPANAPLPSFETMQSAAFGGIPADRASKAETTVPQAYASSAAARPVAAAPDIDLGLVTAPSHGIDVDVDVPLDEPAPGGVDLLFDEPAPPPLAARAAAAPPASVDLAFDDLMETSASTTVPGLGRAQSAPAAPPGFVSSVPLNPVAPVASSASTNVTLPAASLLRIDLGNNDNDDVTRIGVASTPAEPLPGLPAVAITPAATPAAATPVAAAPLAPPPPAAAKPPPPAYAAPPAWMPPPNTPSPPPVVKTAPPVTACPQCLSTVGANDVFCGVCGYRVK